jgi:hypothetical protein
MLGDKVVVQEFADGSLARLCAECAAGIELNDTAPPAEKQSEATFWPDPPAEDAATTAAETDPLEKTRELLMPVTDLIALQGEMQAALERLAAALERFALEMITESQGRSAVQSRVQELERELDKTRTQLSEAEFLLSAATRPAQLAPTETPPMPTIGLPEVAARPESSPVTRPAAPVASQPVATAPVAEATQEPMPAWPTEPPAADRPLPNGQPLVERRRQQRRKTPGIEVAISAAAERRHLPDRRKNQIPAAPGPVTADSHGRPLVPPPGGPGGAPAAVEQTTGSTFIPAKALADVAHELADGNPPTFRIDEVQAAQRYYNESPFVNRIADVRRSLGRPRANVTRVAGEASLAFVTIMWDIIWYQYLVDLRRDIPLSAERVCLYREGMDLDELAFYFREKNAVVNDDGKLDASELEVRLLSDPSALIPEMVSEETVLMDDLTEEHWGSRVAPEFKWDD